MFALINRQRQLESDAAHKTKVARREVQKRIEYDKARNKKSVELPTVTNPTKTTPPPSVRGYDPTKVIPFDDEY